tara:strand:+ start:215 stop:412 length:198 start_codon:yes stop_codon:yes gene_type:complete
VNNVIAASFGKVTGMGLTWILTRRNGYLLECISVKNVVASLIFTIQKMMRGKKIVWHKMSGKNAK